MYLDMKAGVPLLADLAVDAGWRSTLNTWLSGKSQEPKTMKFKMLSH